MHIYTFTPVKHIHVHCEVLKKCVRKVSEQVQRKI